MGKRNKKRQARTPVVPAPRVNPFEKIIAKPKHHVVGKRNKGAEKQQGKALADALSRRKKSLKFELSREGKANKFIDKRFGEKDTDLTNEDKALQRFQMQRQSKLKKSVYNLDDSAANDKLTHGGKSISDLQHLGEEQFDEDDMGIDPNEAGHFTGPDDRKDGSRDNRTKSEIMAEVIAKSKMFKAEKQQQKADQMQLVNDLDADFTSLRSLIEFKTQEDRERAKAEKKDEFILEARKLAEEIRVRAAEKAKTPEQAAQEEKERLEQLERKRVLRMQGIVEVDDGKQDKDKFKKNKRRRVKEQMEASAKANSGMTGDALTQNFTIDSKYTIEPEGDSDEDEASGEDVDEQLTKMEKAYDSSDDEEADGEELPKPTLTEEERKAAEKELPYTFASPQTYRDFTSLLKGRSFEEHIMIVQRIKTCHHPSLGPENIGKMQVFYSVLLDYVSQFCKKKHSEKEFPGRLNRWLSVLYEFCELMPKHAAAVSRERVRIIRSKFHERLQSPNAYVCHLPKGHELCLLKSFGLIYPTSDFKHNVVIPTMLFLSECLTRAPIRNARGVLHSLFVAQLLLGFVVQSRRVVPELIAFLPLLLRSGFGLNQVDGEDILPDSNPLPITFPEPLNLWTNIDKKSCPKSVDAQLSVQLLLNTQNDAVVLESPAFKASSLLSTIALMRSCADTYGMTPSFPEIARMLLDSLRAVLPHAKGLPKQLRTPIKELTDSLESRLTATTKSRLPLVVKARPVALKMYNPVYHENFAPGKDLDPDTLRAENKKLTKKLKREKKGAMRELRRDTEFIAQEKRKKYEQKMEDKQQRRREVQAMLQQQATDTNIMTGKRKRGKK